MSKAILIIPRPSAKDAARFWSYVIKKGPRQCWLWRTPQKSVRYPVFVFGPTTYRANRVAYVFHYGPLPDPSLLVLHSCDVPRCCNPRHLFLGTNLDNSRDKVAKGRSPTGLRNGAYTHPEKRPRGDRHGSHTKPEAFWRGERINTAKLTAAQVKRMRREYAAGTLTVTAAMQRYGCGRSNVHYILKRVTWRHV